MRAQFRDYLAAVAGHISDHQHEALAKVLAGWSVNGGDWDIRCCDAALAIVAKPIPLREKHEQLHRFICDSVP